MTKSIRWVYEPETKTIRSKPGNHWIASMDSFDGAVDHEYSAKLIAAAPQLLEALRKIANAAASDLCEYVQEVDGIACETLAQLDFPL